MYANSKMSHLELSCTLQSVVCSDVVLHLLLPVVDSGKALLGKSVHFVILNCFPQKPILLQGHERSITQIKYNREGDLLFSVAKDTVSY